MSKRTTATSQWLIRKRFLCEYANFRVKQASFDAIAEMTTERSTNMPMRYRALWILKSIPFDAKQRKTIFNWKIRLMLCARIVDWCWMIFVEFKKFHEFSVWSDTRLGWPVQYAGSVQNDSNRKHVNWLERSLWSGWPRIPFELADLC